MKLFLSLLLLLSFNMSFGAKLDKIELYKVESIWQTSSGEQFRLCRISSNGALKVVKEKKIKIHFKEDSDRVSKRDKSELRKFFKNLPENTFNIKLAAHADSCGDPDYNAKLAKRRGDNVYFFIKDLMPKYMPISGENHGENKSSDHSKHDKFVEVIAEYWITDEEFTRIVLFDVSGSLHEKKIGKTYYGYTLDGLKQIKLEPGTIAYVPRDIRYRCEGQSLKGYHPIGEDFYWEAMTLISTSIKGAASGTVYTDDTDPRGNDKEALMYKIDKRRKVRWHIK